MKIQVGGLLNLEGAKVAGNGTELSLQAGEIQGRGALLQQYGSGALRISAANMILPEASLQSAGTLELRAADLIDLRAARLGSGMTTAVTTARLDHRGAQLLGDAGVQLHVADQLLNDGGQIQSATGSVTLRGQAAVTNSGGLIAAIGGVDLEARSWGQAQAGRVAGRDTRLQLTADLRQSADSSISADRELRLQARQLESQGQLEAGTDMTLNSAGHADLGGRTYADHSLVISGGGDLQLRGLLATQGDLHIKASGQVMADANAILAAGLDREGQLSSSSRLVVDAGGVLASQGQLMAERVLLSSPQGLDLSHSKLQAWGELAVHTAGALITEGSRLSVNHLELRAQDWRNAGGQVALGTTSKQDLVVDGRLDNHGGLIRSDAGELRLSAQTLDNQLGSIFSRGDLRLQSAVLDNQGGAISGQNLDLTVQTLRNTGEGLLASEGKLTLKGDTLINSGFVQSNDQLHISSRELLENTGRIRGLHDLQLAAGQLTQQGSTSALGNLVVQADRLQGSGTFAAGLQADGTLASTADLRFDIAQRLQYSGSLLAGAQLRMAGADLQLQGAQIQAANVNLRALAQALRLDGATVAAAGELSLQSPGLLSTQGAELSGARFAIRAADWLNAGGRIGQVTHDGEITATVTGRLQNSGGGQIVANGLTLQLEAAQLDNRQGSIVQAGNAGSVMKIQAGSLDGEQGAVLTRGELDLQVADTADLRRSNTQAQQLVLRTGRLQHQGAQTLIDGDARVITMADLDNRGGLFQATGALTMQAGTLQNDDGQLDGRQLVFDGRQITNLGQGLLQGRDGLSLNAASLHNAGHVQSGGETKVHVSGDLQNSGVVYAEGSARIDAGFLEHSGTVAAAGDLRIQADAIASSGAFSAGLTAHNHSATPGALEVTSRGRLQHSGISLARGRLSMSAADLALQGTRSDASEVLMQAAGDLRLQGAQLATAGALQLQAGTVLDTSNARLTAAQVTVSANDWQHAKGQLLQSAASGTLDVQLNGNLLNQDGRIEAAGHTTTLQAAAINNEHGRIVHAGQGPLHLKADALLGQSGQILANGDLNVEVVGHTDLRQGQTQARDIALRANSLQHEGGQMLASGEARMVVREALENHAGLLQASGGFQLQAGSLGNRDGQVSGKRIDLQLGELNNAGQALIRAEQDLHLDARIARNAGALQAGGNVDIKADTDLINNGSVYAQGAARYSLGGQLQNDGTLAARDDLMLQARAVTGSGTLAAGLSTDNILGSKGSLSVHVAQGLNQHGALLAAASLEADAAYMQLEDSRIHAGQSLTLTTSGALALDRASVASLGAMVLSSASELSTEGANLQAATVALQAGEWRHMGGTLTQRGPAGELKATITGTLNNAGGQIQAEGSQLRLEAAYLDNASGRLVQAGMGDMSLQVGTLQGQAGQILSKNGLSITATDAIYLSQAQTQAHDLTISAASLDHRGGSLQSTGPTTVNVAGQLNNHGGTLLSAASMQLRTGSIDNAGGGLLQSNTELLATVDAELNNQGGQLRSAGDLQLTAKSLDNSNGGRIGSSGALRLTVAEAALNNGGSLLADQPVTVTATSLANQKGQIASLRGSATLRVNGPLSNEQGRLQAANALDVVSGSLNNRLGELSARQILLDSKGQAVDNGGGRLLAQEQLTVRSGSLDNTGGLIRSEGGMSLHLEGATLNNLRGAVVDSPTGIHAQERLELAAASVINESGVSSGGTLELYADQLSNRADISAGSLNVHVRAALDNQGGRLIGNQIADLRAEQIFKGGGLIHGGDSLTVLADRGIYNTDTRGREQGLQGGRINISANQLDNRNGQLLANGDLQLTVTQSLNNAGGQIGAGGSLTIGDGDTSVHTSALTLENRAGRIWAGNGLSLTVGTLAGGVSGDVSSRGSLSLKGLTGDWVYGTGSQLQAMGDLSISLTGRFTNQGALRAGGALSIRASQIDNQASGEINGHLTLLDTGAGMLSNRGLIDGDGVAIAAGQVLNLGNGRLYGGDVVIDASSLNNEREGSQAAVIAARRTLDGRLSGDIVNRNGALLFADGDLHLSGASLLNENASVEASRWLQLEMAGGLTNSSVHAGAGSGLDTSGGNEVRILESKALIRSGGSMQVTTGGALLNSGSTIEALGDLDIAAGEVRNENPYLMWRTAGDPLGDKVHFVGTLTFCDSGVEGGHCEKTSDIDEWVYLNGRTPRMAWGDFVAPLIGTNNYSTLGISIQGAPSIKRFVPGWGDVFLFEPYIEPENSGIVITAGGALNGQHPGVAWTEYIATRPEYAGITPDVSAGGTTGVSQSSAARITVGGELRVQGGQITNDMSIVEGRGGVAITGASVNNVNRMVTVVDPSTGVQRQVSLTLPTQNRSGAHVNSAPITRAAGGTVGADPGPTTPAGISAGAMPAASTAELAGIANQTSSAVAATSQAPTDATAQASWREGPTIDARAVMAGTATNNPPSVQAGQQQGRSGVQAVLRAALQARARDADVDAALLRQVNRAAAEQSADTGTVSLERGLGAAQHQSLATAPSLQGKALARTLSVGLDLPNNSLFHFRRDPGAHYLVETDPQFANYRNWLSSDYMLKAMALDPAVTQKRLGDGFYEQRLVREQLGLLTGASFLPGYSSDEAMYQALLENGASFGKQYQLRPGVALSAEQMSQLTTDLVWLVEQPVTLADGSVQRVLVPQVYLLPREGDLQPHGALIAGHRIEMALSGDFVNQGQVEGGDLVNIQAQNVSNSGSVRGATLALTAREDIRSTGGEFRANGDLSLVAGRDIVLQTTTASGSTQQGNVNTRDTVVDRVAALTAGGVLLVQSGRDVNLQAVQISQGDPMATTPDGGVFISTGRDLNLTTVQTASARDEIRNANNFKKESSTEDVGSQIKAAGIVALTAGQDLNAKAATLESSMAGVSLMAGRDLALLAGEATDVIEQMSQRTKRGFLKKKTTTSYSKSAETTALGTVVSGQTLNIQAGRDLSLSAAQAVSDRGTNLQAGGNITIDGVADRVVPEQFSKTTKSGLFGGGGLGITIGKQSLAQAVKTSQDQYHGSIVGAVQGDVSITAGGGYRQVGSQVQAPGGDVSILAKAVDIVEARELASQNAETQFKRSGLSVSVTSPVISALQTARSQIKAGSQTSDARIKSLAAANIALNGRQAVDAVQAGRALEGGNAADKAGGIGVSISLGSTRSQSQQNSQADTAHGSSVRAGGDITIQAIGAGQNSDLSVRGSEISAAGHTLLRAEDQLNLVAAQNSTQESSRSRNSSGSIGVGINLGSNGVSAGVTLSASAGKGQGAGDATSYSNSLISGNRVTLESGGDTTLKGAVVQGERVRVEAGGNLGIESLQDQHQYREKSKQVGGSVTIGPSPGGSLSAGQTRINSDFVSVGEQSAIRAGDGGFDVQVAGKTQLTGAQITSTQAAIDQDNNRYEAKQGTTTTDLQNSARYEAKSVSVGLAVGTPKPGASLSAGLSGVGLGSDTGSAGSTSTAGISGMAGNTAARTGEADAGIKQIFDAAAVKNEVEAQVEITQEFNKHAGQAIELYITGQRSILQEKAKRAATPEERAQAEQGIKDVNMQERALNILVSAFTGMAGAAITKESLSTAAEKMRDLMIEDSKKFAGVVDSTGNVLSNVSGASEGIRGDGYKIGGTRLDLYLLCGPLNKRCVHSKDGSLEVDTQNRVQFDEESAGMTWEKFLETPEGQKMSGATGGVQGVKGTLFGHQYTAGSWQDKLIEAFAGTHDFIGGKLSGLYDAQGNATRGRDSTTKNLQDAWSASGAILVSLPFAAAEGTSPEVWKAIGILLRALK